MRLEHSALWSLKPANHKAPEGPYLLGFALLARNLPQFEHTMVVPGTGTVNPVFMRFLAEIGGNSRGEFPLEVELTGRMQHPAGSNHTHERGANG